MKVAHRCILTILNIKNLVDSIFFRTFAAQLEQHYSLKLNEMKRITTFGDTLRVESFDLSEEQHNIAVELVKENKRKVNGYTLEEADKEMANVWIADAHSEGNEDYAEFLRVALASNADLYTLTDHLGDFSQPIGEVAVYN